MKMANAKRKKAMQMSDVEKQNGGRLFENRTIRPVFEWL
jgi:hypothetical protein